MYKFIPEAEQAGEIEKSKPRDKDLERIE